MIDDPFKVEIGNYGYVEIRCGRHRGKTAYYDRESGYKTVVVELGYNVGPDNNILDSVEAVVRLSSCRAVVEYGDGGNSLGEGFLGDGGYGEHNVTGSGCSGGVNDVSGSGVSREYEQDLITDPLLIEVAVALDTETSAHYALSTKENK